MERGEEGGEERVKVRERRDGWIDKRDMRERDGD